MKIEILTLVAAATLITDVLLAADVLGGDRDSVNSLIDVLQFYLSNKEGQGGEGQKQKRAIIIDPVNSYNRDTFCYAARRAGLETDRLPFQDDFVLLSVTPR